MTASPAPPKAPVRLYTKAECKYCQQVKVHLAARGVTFEEIDIYETLDARAEVVRLAGRPVVPVLVQDGEITVGMDGLCCTC